MKNDLWYIGGGFWAAYSEAPDIIAEFRSMREMRLAATYYHYRKSGVKAAQFFFHQGGELARGRYLLSYVCTRMMLDFKAAVALSRKNDSTPYSKKYPLHARQLELFDGSFGGRSRKRR
ncbi:MAG TPA: hypothetical protein PK728_08035 [Bacillota bacterium]|nr:hypothetical protein [Bacillota bacterium]